MLVTKRTCLLLVILLFIWASACKTSEEFTGYSYDPEGVTETYDRVVNSQHKRTIGFRDDGVWISNEFDGARASDVYRLDKNHYKVVIEPEISPINDSAWYGFRVWSEEPADIKIELEYNKGRQRYFPAISRDDGSTWQKMSSDNFHRDSESGNGILTLSVTDEPVLISAQEVFAANHLQEWLGKISGNSYIRIDTVGNSHRGRPIQQLSISDSTEFSPKGVVIVYNRQHPPEVPGYKTGLRFLEVLASDSDMAREFRNYFEVWAFPMMNPDGVDKGHWRTNAAGVDLNRDWEYFRQPETRAVRRALLPLKDSTEKRVFFAIDFHSTGENVFYPINRDIETFPLHFTYRWAQELERRFPELNLRVEPFDISSPIAKNWSHKTFGVDAVTFEVWDELPRDKLQRLSTISAEIFMEMMIEEYKNEYAVRQ